MISIYYEKRVSEKTKRPYDCITADLGWRVAVLTFDRTTISDLLNISNRGLSEISPDTVIKLGEIDPTVVG